MVSLVQQRLTTDLLLVHSFFSHNPTQLQRGLIQQCEKFWRDVTFATPQECSVEEGNTVPVRPTCPDDVRHYLLRLGPDGKFDLRWVVKLATADAARLAG